VVAMPTGSTCRRPPCPDRRPAPRRKGRSRTLWCHLASEMSAGRRICTPNEGSLSDLAGDGPWAHLALPVLDVSSVRRPAGGRKVGLNIGSVAGCGGLGLPASVAGRTLLRSPVAFRTDVGVRARGGHVGAPRGRFRDGLPSGCGSSINRVLSGYRVRPAHSGASRGPAWAGCCPSRPCAATRTRAGPGGIDGGGRRPRGRPPVACDMVCCCPRRQWPWGRAGSGPGRRRSSPVPRWPNWCLNCLPFKLFAVSTKDGKTLVRTQHLPSPA
jgi:hypothetical protein